jgi:transposase
VLSGIFPTFSEVEETRERRMISVDVVRQIHNLKFEQGKTYAQIQAELGLSSKTIAKALLRPAELLDGYQRTVPSAKPVIGPFQEKIEELLRGKDWAKETGRKIRRTSRWVWRQLKREGFQGAESTVRAHIREKLKLVRPACPIEHFPAREVQFDFGECAVKIAGEVTVIHFVGAIYPYSTRRFLFAYPAERQECLFDAIERVYQGSAGVTEVATLDNTKLAVKKVLEGRRREETEAYERFRTLLGLGARYTNRAAGWEKGHVEGTVGWAKRQVLLDLEVDSWEELWRVLEEACDEDARVRRHGEAGKLVSELFEEEKGLLRPLRYEGRRSYRIVRPEVSPGGLIFVDKSRYSVPIGLRGRQVRARLFWDELVVINEGKEVARHKRDWKGGTEHYQVEHYIELLSRAPALLDHGKPFVRMPEWLLGVRKAMEDDRGFIGLLLAVEKGKYSLAELEQASCEALKGGSVTAAVLEQKAILSRSRGEPLEALEAKDCAGLEKHHFAIESPAVYDELLVKEEEAA